jgi:integrase/recombinase XerD
LQDGQFHSDVRKTTPPFVCPACFKSEYEAFCEELAYREYSKATIESNMPIRLTQVDDLG